MVDIFRKRNFTTLLYTSPGEYCSLQRVLVELVLSCGGLEVDEEGEAGGVGGGGGGREEGGVEGAQVCPRTRGINMGGP